MVTLVTLKSWSGSGAYDDKTALLLAPIAVPAGLVVSVHLSFRACDQGWGNRKGRVFATASIPFKGATGERTQLPSRDKSDRWASEVVSHDSAPVKQTFLADSGFVTKLNDPASIWTEERTIELERHVGGGGGHKLHINDLQLTVQIKPLAELARAFAAEHPLRVGFLSGHVVTIPTGWLMPEAGPKNRRPRRWPESERLSHCEPQTARVPQAGVKPGFNMYSRSVRLWARDFRTSEVHLSLPSPHHFSPYPGS